MYQDISRLPIDEASTLAPLMEEAHQKIYDEVLHYARRDCLSWGVEQNNVIILIYAGRIWFRVLDDDSVSIVFVPRYIYHEYILSKWLSYRVEFLVNKDEIKSLGIYLRDHSYLMVHYQSIFNGEFYTPESQISLVRNMDISHRYGSLSNWDWWGVDF
jgi:hypothetical protein